MHSHGIKDSPEHGDSTQQSRAPQTGWKDLGLGGSCIRRHLRSRGVRGGALCVSMQRADRRTAARKASMVLVLAGWCCRVDRAAMLQC